MRPADGVANDRITAHDVARRAGVSQSAVSRVFTPGASVSKQVMAKVHGVAAELGYRPNALARSLITGRSRMIGLVVAYLENQFYPAVLERLSAALQQQGYHVLVFLAPTADNVDPVMQEIMAYQVDGIVLASVSISSRLAAQCRSSGIPVVLFNRSQDDARLSSVTTDNFAGGQALARHLVALGHSRIGYIAGDEGASTQRDREAGFREALAAAGLGLFARGVGNFEHSATREAALRMFDRPDHPDAVFACSDTMAFATMDVLRFELGLRVPEDVSVVGFDDVTIAAWLSYNLTTFRQSVDRMVAETVATLIGHIEGDASAPRRLQLDGTLVVRRSTQARKGPTA